MPNLELKSISCKGVKSFIPFQKPSLSLSVSIAKSNDAPVHSPHRAPIDKEGGENPEWNQPIQLEIPTLSKDEDLFVLFEIRNHNILLGASVVGRVRVPLPELEAEQMPGIFHFVSYQVRSQDGKPNGVLTFGYKMKDRETSDFHSLNDPVSHFRPPDSIYAPPAQSVYPSAVSLSSSSSLYPPLPETQSIYPRPPEVSSIYSASSMYPPVPEIGPIYPPPVPEMYGRPPVPGFYGFPGVGPAGGCDCGPATGEWNGGGYYPPRDVFCAYPDPAEGVGCQVDGWSGMRIR